MKVSFLGAAREVTGSCYFFETATARFVVDCGMHQGGREAPARNRQPFGFDPRALDFVLLTHAHIDHSGLLPKLMRDGFSGPIYTTGATADLLGVMLPDSGHIQEMDAERAARRRKRAKDKSAATPLYTVQDAQESLKLLRCVPYDERVELHAGVTCRFRDAGHILGSAIIEIWITEDGKTTKLVMSGDLGQPGRAILRDPATIDEADVLFIESTYGDRLHKDLPATLDELVEVIEHTLRHGNVIVPAFAVGRTQEILYHLHRLTRQGRLSGLQILVDSPMATAATEVTKQHLALFDDEAHALARLARRRPGPARVALYRQRRGVDGAEPDSVRRHRHLRQRHVQRRAHQAPPAPQPRAARVRCADHWVSRRRARSAGGWSTGPSVSASSVKRSRCGPRSTPWAASRPMPISRRCWPGPGPSSTRRAGPSWCMARKQPRSPSPSGCAPTGAGW